MTAAQEAVFGTPSTKKYIAPLSTKAKLNKFMDEYSLSLLEARRRSDDLFRPYSEMSN